MLWEVLKRLKKELDINTTNNPKQEKIKAAFMQPFLFSKEAISLHL